MGTDTDDLAVIQHHDLIRRMKDVQCEKVLITEVMLRSEGDKFLDDVTFEELGEFLGVKAYAVPNDGYVLLDMIINGGV